MRNFIQPGETITAIAPAGGIVSGAGLLIGSLFGVAAYTAAEDAEVEVAVEGVFELAKVNAQAWALGEPVFWDAATKLVTNVATGNVLIGTAVAVAANPSPTGRVRLGDTASTASAAALAALAARVTALEQA